MEFNSKSISMSALRRIMLAMLFVMAIPAFGFAQKIVGTITDEQGEPLIGATIMVEGTTTGATTDIDGKYSVNAKKGQTLTFTYVGMDTQKVKIGNSKVDERLVAYGAIAEYMFLTGMYDEASMWDKRYKDLIQTTLYPNRSIRIPQRRWE